jgi:prevent-host-death family protein
MDTTINAKELRASLPDMVRRVQRGESFTVLYRSRPAFRIVPIGSHARIDGYLLENDSLYGAPPVGRSSDGLTSEHHDQLLYPTKKR